jgi:hypothetical protein
MKIWGRRLWEGAMALVVLVTAGDASAADCLTSEGKTACGFHCVSGEGQVRCAQTPEGVCSVASGVVACWDPPSVLKRALPVGIPAPECTTTYGQTACGYSCETNSDHALCAQTPFGACAASEGKLACWDPPAAVLVTHKEKTPVAQCVATSGKIACGYQCIAHEGVVRCAETPEGGCRIEQGKIVCWDPPLDSLGAVYDPATELACMEGIDPRACGYRCIATTAHSACGSRRSDSCRSESGRIVCGKPD